MQRQRGKEWESSRGERAKGCWQRKRWQRSVGESLASSNSSSTGRPGPANVGAISAVSFGLAKRTRARFSFCDLEPITAQAASTRRPKGKGRVSEQSRTRRSGSKKSSSIVPERIGLKRNGTGRHRVPDGTSNFLFILIFSRFFLFDCLTSSRVSSAAYQCVRLFGRFSSFLLLLLKNLKNAYTYIHICTYMPHRIRLDRTVRSRKCEGSFDTWCSRSQASSPRPREYDRMNAVHNYL